MEQPQTLYITPSPDELGGICLSKQNSILHDRNISTTTRVHPAPCKLQQIFNSQAPMERPTYGMAMICITVLAVGLMAALACVGAEFKRTKVEDVKLDSKLCRLPRSPSFFLGIAACIFLLITQIIGSSAFSFQFCSRHKELGIHSNTKTIAITIFLLSWVTFGFAVLLASVGASMNKSQYYGDGWLNEECYVVRKGVFIAAAASGLVTLSLLLGSIILAATTQCAIQEDKLRLDFSSQTQPR